MLHKIYSTENKMKSFNRRIKHKVTGAENVADISKESISGKDVLHSFEAVLWLLFALGIPLMEKPKTGIFKKASWLLLEAIGHCSYICVALMSISMLARYNESNNKKIAFATCTFSMAGTGLRYSIYFRRKNIRLCIQRLSGYQPAAFTKETLRKIKLFTWIGCAVTILNQIVVSLFATTQNLKFPRARQTYVSDNFFGLKSDPDSMLQNILVPTALTIYTVCVFAPLDSLAVLFCALAYCIKKYFDKLTVKATSGRHSVWFLLQEYGRIDNLILKMDNVFSLIVFLAFVCTANSIYYNSVAFIHKRLGAIGVTYVAAAISLSINTTIMVSMTSFASEMHSSSQSIRPRLSEIRDTDKKFINKIWLIMKMDQGIYLTVWKILPLTKNLILGYLGTIFTYSLLIDSIVP